MILSFLKFIPTKPTHLDSRTNCPIQIRTPSSIIPQNQNKNKKKKKMSEQNYHEQTRVLYELCSMTTHLLHSPPFSITFPGGVRSLITSSQASSSSSPPPLSGGFGVSLRRSFHRFDVIWIGSFCDRARYDAPRYYFGLAFLRCGNRFRFVGNRSCRSLGRPQILVIFIAGINEMNKFMFHFPSS